MSIGDQTRRTPPPRTAGMAAMGSDQTQEAFEELDAIVQTAPPRAWTTLAALVFLLIASLVFACFYRTPTKVKGEGFLVAHQETLVPVVARGSGRLLDLAIEGTTAKAEGLMGLIAQDDSRELLQEKQAELSQRLMENTAFARFHLEEETEQNQSLKKIREALVTKVRNSERRRSTAENLVRKGDELNDRIPGATSAWSRLQSLELLHRLESEIEEAHSQLEELEYERIKTQNQRKREQMERQSRIDLLKVQTTLLEEQLKRKSQICSPCQGVVRQIFKPVGAMIHEGDVLALIEKSDSVGREAREVIAFVPAAQGKRIQVNQIVEVSPTTARREEHGFIRGKVTQVSDLPPDKAAVLAKIQHPGLVERFLQGPNAEVYTVIQIELLTRTPPHDRLSAGWSNSLEWSSKSGNTLVLQSWTFCSLAVHVEDQYLISLVIPWLKRQTGLEPDF